MELTTVTRGNSSEGISSCFNEPMVITPKTATKTVIKAISARFARDSVASLCMA